MAHLDYPKLIERMKYYDKNSTYIINKKDFGCILEDMQISKDPAFVEITFNALKMEGYDGIKFNDIRALYENSIFGVRNKMMMLILFRGADTDRDGWINYNEFSKLYNILFLNKTEKDIQKMFHELDKHKVGKLSYRTVARKLFSIKVRAHENPYKQKFCYIPDYAGHCDIS